LREIHPREKRTPFLCPNIGAITGILLTYELVSNHLYDAEETAMGHLHKRRQNIRSTKIKPVPTKPKPVQYTIEDLEPELQGQFFIKKDRTERVGVHLVGMEDLNGMISTDQTGRFPIKSLTGFLLWRQYWRHFWGSFFYGGISPSKIGLIVPYWEPVQALSKARVFLLG
jgi:hypothetical protein